MVHGAMAWGLGQGKWVTYGIDSVVVVALICGSSGSAKLGFHGTDTGVNEMGMLSIGR